MIGSNRRFGLVLVAACVVLMLLGLWHRRSPRFWFVAAVVLFLVTLAVPRTLDPLRRLWLKLGGALHVVISPILLALFYFGAVAPIGLVLRLMRRDLLRLKRGGESYWIERKPPGPEPRTMAEMF